MPLLPLLPYNRENEGTLIDQAFEQIFENELLRIEKQLFFEKYLY